MIQEEFKAEVVDLGEIVAAILWNRDVQAYLNAKAPSIRVGFSQPTPMVMIVNSVHAHFGAGYHFVRNNKVTKMERQVTVGADNIQQTLWSAVHLLYMFERSPKTLADFVHDHDAPLELWQDRLAEVPDLDTEQVVNAHPCQLLLFMIKILHERGYLHRVANAADDSGVMSADGPKLAQITTVRSHSAIRLTILVQIAMALAAVVGGVNFEWCAHPACKFGVWTFINFRQYMLQPVVNRMNQAIQPGYFHDTKQQQNEADATFRIALDIALKGLRNGKSFMIQLDDTVGDGVSKHFTVRNEEVVALYKTRTDSWPEDAEVYESVAPELTELFRTATELSCGTRYHMQELFDYYYFAAYFKGTCEAPSNRHYPSNRATVIAACRYRLFCADPLQASLQLVDDVGCSQSSVISA